MFEKIWETLFIIVTALCLALPASLIAENERAFRWAGYALTGCGLIALAVLIAQVWLR